IRRSRRFTLFRCGSIARQPCQVGLIPCSFKLPLFAHLCYRTSYKSALRMCPLTCSRAAIRRANTRFKLKHYILNSDFCEHLLNRSINLPEYIAEHRLDIHTNRTVPAWRMSVKGEHAMVLNSLIDV